MQLACLCVPLIMCICSAIACSLVKRIDRRTQILMSTIGGALSALMFIALGTMKENLSSNQPAHLLIQFNENFPNFLKFSVLAPMALTLITFILGVGSIAYTIPMECTNSSHAGHIQTFVIAVYYLVSTISMYAFPLMKNALGAQVFYLFVGINSVGAVYVYFRGVESRNRDISEVVHDFKMRETFY